MNLGPRGAALIKGFEKLVLVAYLDEHGYWTIGYGHKGADVHQGLVWTLDQAERQFDIDASSAVSDVNHSLSIARQLTQNQFDALTSFTFNLGGPAEAHSTLIKLVNAGDDAAAADEFLKWDHVGKKVSAGLDVRRHAERALYLSTAA